MRLFLLFKNFLIRKCLILPIKELMTYNTIKYAENKTYEILSALYSSNKAKELGLDRKYKKFLEICNIRTIKGSN